LSEQPGRELRDVFVDEYAPITHCRACGAPIWFGRTAAGKPNPFDMFEGRHTAVTHFSTCPHVRQFEHGRGRE
jgi:hypothetical protein